MEEQEIDPRQVNKLIVAWREGEQGAYNQLISLLHEDLRNIARRLFNNERAAHTLQTDDLIGKLYIKLLGSKNVPWESYVHFLNAASRTMRQILIDHARNWQRRGDGQGRVVLDQWELDQEMAITGESSLHYLIGMNEAIERLQTLDATMANVADWKLSLGLTLNEIARKLDIPLTNVKREWLMAKKILGNAVWGRDTD